MSQAEVVFSQVFTRLPEDKIEIHTSDRRVFKRCRRKYDFSSKLRRGLEPKRPNTIFYLGTGVHHALQKYYEALARKETDFDMVQCFGEWIAEQRQAMADSGTILSPEESAKFDETEELGYGMLEHYLEWCVPQDTFEPYKMEVMFDLPIINPEDGKPVEAVHPTNGKIVPVTYSGRFDGVVKDKTNGNYWILENKTAKSFSDWDDKLSMDEQVSSYVMAAERLFDIRVEGIIYNGLLKTIPRPPKLLKNGSLSQDKRIKTTRDIYMQTILEHQLNPNDYVDILDMLETKGNTFFRREYVRKTPEEIATQAEQIYYETVDMLQSDYFYPNPTRDCSWDCDFKELCGIIQAKGDPESFVASMYQHRQDEEELFYEKEGE